MIVLSMVLVVVGFVLLMLGVLGIGDNPLDFVYYSIGACLLAAVFLVIGVVRGRPSKKPVTASGGEGKDASWSGASAWNDGNGDKDSSTAVLERDQSADEGKPRVQVVAAQQVAGTRDNDGHEGWAPAEDGAAPTPGGATAVTDEVDDADGSDDVVVVPKASATSRTADLGVEVVAAEDLAAGDENAAAAPPQQASAKKASAKKATAKKASAKKATAKKASAKKATAKKASAKKASAKKAPASSRATELQKFEDSLASVNGVGPAKRKVLADHFGTYANLKSASVAEIAQIDGISETVATRIRNSLDAQGD